MIRYLILLLLLLIFLIGLFLLWQWWLREVRGYRPRTWRARWNSVRFLFGGGVCLLIPVSIFFVVIPVPIFFLLIFALLLLGFLLVGMWINMR